MKLTFMSLSSKTTRYSFATFILNHILHSQPPFKHPSRFFETLVSFFLDQLTVNLLEARHPAIAELTNSQKRYQSNI